MIFYPQYLHGSVIASVPCQSVIVPQMGCLYANASVLYVYANVLYSNTVFGPLSMTMYGMLSNITYPSNCLLHSLVSSLLGLMQLGLEVDDVLLQLHNVHLEAHIGLLQLNILLLHA